MRLWPSAGVDYKLRRKVNYIHLTSHMPTACSPKPTTHRIIVNRQLMIFMTHLMIFIRALASNGVSAGYIEAYCSVQLSNFATSAERSRLHSHSLMDLHAI